VDLILRAFAFVSEEIQDAVLVVGSDGSQSEDLARRAEELGIADRIAFTGYIEDDDKRALMGNPYLYVQPPHV
jgi:glycosyltransferase involved in cell wall biosynthesis